MRGLSPVAASGGHSLSWCAGLSLSRPLPLRSTGSRRAGSVVVAHGPSCSAACGIFPDRGSNPCPLHWQADSEPLRHQGSPRFFYSYPFSRSVVFKSFFSIKFTVHNSIYSLYYRIFEGRTLSFFYPSNFHLNFEPEFQEICDSTFYSIFEEHFTIFISFHYIAQVLLLIL